MRTLSPVNLIMPFNPSVPWELKQMREEMGGKDRATKAILGTEGGESGEVS